LNFEAIADAPVGEPVVEVPEVDPDRAQAEPPDVPVAAHPALPLLVQKLVPVFQDAVGHHLVAIASLPISAQVGRAAQLGKLGPWNFPVRKTAAERPGQGSPRPADLLVLAIVEVVDLVDILSAKPFPVKDGLGVEVDALPRIGRDVPGIELEDGACASVLDCRD